MKASYYNVFFPFEDNYVLFNTLRESIFVIDSEIKTLLEKNEVSSLTDEYIEVFRDNGIITDGVSEIDQVKLMVNRSRYDTTSADLHIITTYRCNLLCTYCCEEKGVLVSKDMDETAANCVIKFIKDSASNNNSEKLGIELFGGEPLLNMPVNLLIAKDLSEWCEESNRKFSLNTVTNGTLLTSENIEELAVYNCGFLVILDGPKEIHDQRRMYKNGKGTFGDIVDGLSRVIDYSLEVVVRINVDEFNKDHIVSLLEFLKDNNLHKARISIRPVFNTFPSRRWYKYCILDATGSKIQTQLFHIAKTMNFNVDQPEKSSLWGACLAQKISYFTVDPHLRLFKCVILPPFEKNSVGVISKDSMPIFNQLNIDFLSRDPVLFDECRDCKLLPVCCGGCPAQVLELMGTTHGKVCNRPGLYETLEGNLINSVKRNL